MVLDRIRGQLPVFRPQLDEVVRVICLLGPEIESTRDDVPAVYEQDAPTLKIGELNSMAVASTTLLRCMDV